MLRVLIILAATSVAFGLSAVTPGRAWSDDGNSPSARESASSSTDRANAESDAVPPTDEGRLPQSDNENRRAETFTEIFEADAEHLADRPKAIYISRLELNGVVQGDTAEVTAAVDVELTRATGDWYVLPLGFDQASLLSSRYEGPGDAAPEGAERQGSGQRWVFRGKGRHQLTFQLRVPVRRTATGRQLQLTIPELPNGFRAIANLRVDDARAVRGTAGQGTTISSTNATESKGLSLECEVSGIRWDVSWRIRRDDAPTIGAVTTLLRVTRSSNRLQVSALQECRIAWADVDHLRVRIPEGFEIEAVRQMQSDSSQPLRFEGVSGEPGWIKVSLTDDVQDRVELQWELSRPFPDDGEVIRLDGLEIADAGSQSGSIEIEAIPGYFLDWVNYEDSPVTQVDPPDDRPGAANIAYAFKFSHQPIDLDLRFSQIDAETDGTADYLIRLNEGKADLYAAVQIEVLSGSVDRVELTWPGHREDGWRPARTTIPVHVGEQTSSTEHEAILETGIDDDSQDLLSVRIDEPCTGRLSFLLHFERTSASDADGFAGPLPLLNGVSQRSRTLAVAGPIDFEFDVVGESGPLPASPADARLAPGFPEEVTEPASSPITLYRIDSPDQTLNIDVTRHQRSIEANVMVAVTDLRPARLRVIQEVAFSVAYGRIESVLFDRPESLSSVINSDSIALGDDYSEIGPRFRLRDGTPLQAEIVEGHLKVNLDEPRHGDFSIFIDYLLPVPGRSDEHTVSFDVPILPSIDAEYGSTVLQIVDEDVLRLDAKETGWQPELTRTSGEAWSTRTPREFVRLSRDESIVNVPQQYTIETAFLRTLIGDEGQTTTYADYDVREAPARLLIMLPQDTGAADFYWNGRKLTSDREVRPYTGEPGQYLLAIEDGELEALSGRLSVRFRSQSHGVLNFISQRTVQFPRFPQRVWIEETIWEIGLPLGHQLFESPDGMVPQYTWERTVAVWMRRPTRAYRDRRANFIASGSGAPPVSQGGNVYAYRAVGSLQAAQFGSMAQTFIVLIGAGVTLLLGFVFGRIPTTRNVFSILVLGFVFSLASLWRLELMQLLLQPALLGLLLALVATTFDTAARRRPRRRLRETPVEPPPSAVGREQRSSVYGSSSAAPRSQAPTAVYQPSAPSESGGAS